MNHVHAGVLEFAVFVAMLLLALLLLRSLAVKLADKPAGKALSFIVA